MSRFDARRTEYAFDFFISYTASDLSWAQWIKAQLKEAGYEATFQDTDFRAGRSVIGQILDAIERSARMIAIISAPYLESDFARAEWQAALHADPAGTSGKLVPVIVDECRVPVILGALQHVDLTSLDEPAARAALLESIAGAPRLSHAPRFPGPRARKEELAPRQTYPGKKRIPFLVPFARNPSLVGRERELASLRASLRETSAVAIRPPTTVHGLGGIGKTQLAVEYAYRHSSEYDAVLWIRADTPHDFHANVAALSAALNLSEREQQVEAVQTAAVYKWLSQNAGWLLVIDNVDSESAARAVAEWLPAMLPGHVLITSRLNDWPLSFSKVEVDVLSEQDATNFLLERVGRGSRSGVEAARAPHSRADALAVAIALGGLPLALEHAAAHIQRKCIAFTDYLERFKRERRRVLEFYGREGGTGYKHTVASTWRTTQAELGAEALTMLRLLSLLAPERLPRALLASSPQPLREALMSMATKHAGTTDDRRVVEDPTNAAELGLEQLAAYSMISLSPTSISCHLLLMAVEEDQLSANERREWLGLLLRIFLDVTPSEAWDVQHWPTWQRLHPHVATLVGSADRAGIIEGTPRLMDRLGTFLGSSARWAEAESLWRRAVTIDGQAAAPATADVARTMSHLAGVLGATKRAEEAEELLTRARRINEQVYGPESLEVARDLTDLGYLLGARGNVEEAARLHRRALQIDEAHAAASKEVARDKCGLAFALVQQQNFPEAEALFRDALKLDEASFGDGHPEVATDLHGLAKVLRSTHRDAEAEVCLRRALRIDETMIGEHHPTVARDRRELANLLADTGRAEEAKTLAARCLLSYFDFSVRNHFEHQYEERSVEVYRKIGRLTGASEARVGAEVAELRAMAERCATITH